MESKQETKDELSNREYENFRMYHQLQYDRIDKLESKRETFSNLVLTLSAGIYLIGFGDSEKLNDFTGVYLPIIIIFVNIAAIVFASKSRYWIKLHQERAEVARDKYAKELNELNKSANKKYKKKLEDKNWWAKLFNKKVEESKTVEETESKKDEVKVEEPTDNATKKNSDKDLFRREKIYQYLHGLVAIICVFSICAYKKLKDNPEEKKPLKVEISNLSVKIVDLYGKVDSNREATVSIVHDSLEVKINDRKLTPNISQDNTKKSK